MSTPSEPPIVSEDAPPRGTIPPGEAETVQRLVRNEVANILKLATKEAETRERVKRRDDLLRMRRRLRASILTRENEINADRRELDEIERELTAIRLPPGLKLTDE